MNVRLLMAVCLAVRIAGAEAATKAWWHFNGEDGASASSPLKDWKGEYGLQLRKQGTATAKQVTYVSPAAGVLPYVGTSDTPETFSEPVSGGIRFFIPSPALESLDRSEMVGAYLLADPTKSLFGYGDDGKLPEFTLEMFIRVDPYDAAVNDDASVAGDQKGGGLFSLKRIAFENAGNNVLTLEFINDGAVQLRGDSGASANSDRYHALSNEMAEALRDGAWHRVAVVYSLEDSGAGCVKVYCDDTCYINALGKDSAVPYLTTADSSGKVQSGYFSIGDVTGRHASLYVDEVRVSDEALDADGFLRIGKRSDLSFLYPFGDYPANNEFSGSGVTATGTSIACMKADLPLNLKAGDLSYPCAWKYDFGGESCFTVPAEYASVLSMGAFTMEICLQTTSTVHQTVFEHGDEWSLSLDEGKVTWVRSGEDPVTLGGSLADGAWHQLALVYDPETVSGTARFDVLLDGTPLGSVTGQAALPKMYVRPLVLGSGFTGSMLGYRVTPSALPVRKMERLSVVTGDKVLAAWSFDVDCTSGDVALDSSVGTIPEAHGNSFFALTPGTYTSTSFNSGTTEEFSGAYLPAAVQDVPALYVWREDTKRILSAGNRSSVRFRNACTQSGSEWVNSRSGGRLFSVTNGNSCGFKFTAEMFVKAERQFQNNYSLLMNQMSNGTKGRNWMLDAFQNRKLRLSDSTYVNVDVLGDGEWHHVALTYDTEPGSTEISYGIYVDHEAIYSGTCTVGSSIQPFNGGGTFNFGASTASFAFYGLIDEPRVTAGILTPAGFMREFTPRDDLRGLWLASGACGNEFFQGGSLAYLNGTVAGGVSDGTPDASGGMSLHAAGERRIRVGKSAVFDGTGAVTVPAAAIVGADDFTIEVSVKGTGEVFRKERCSGSTFRLSCTDEGAAEAAFDVFDPKYARPDDALRLKMAADGCGLADGAWHHLALTFVRTGTGVYTASLYVDSVLKASRTDIDLGFDGGDLVIGDGFSGSMCGLRFSPEALTADEFMKLERIPGASIIIR